MSNNDLKKHKNMKYWLISSYIILISSLLILSSSIILSEHFSLDLIGVKGENLVVTLFFAGMGWAGSTLFFSILFSYLFNELYGLEEAIRLLFIEVFITAVFLFSLAEAPNQFAKIGFWWVLISPLAAILSSAVFMVPFIKNRKATTILGIVTATTGFISSFLKLPLLDVFNIVLTMMGAILTVIGIGSSEKMEIK